MMGNSFLDVMKRAGGNGQSERDCRVSEALDSASRQLAALISRCDASVRQVLLAEFSSRVRALLKEVESKPSMIPPDFAEWARGQFTEEEIAAGLDEIRQTGGLELRDFLHELEQAAGANE